ncbi:MAG: CBS domain-containing protein [Sedimentisphaerales bacterium]|nr:CBS domain-containing protein [Sedimentisphaerales bacterium]
MNVGKTQEMVYEMKVSAVMTRDVITIGSKERMSRLRSLLQGNRISGVPVLEKGQLVGLISIEDFIKWLANDQEDCAIEERMTREVTTIYEDDPLVLAIRKFESTSLGRFPVITRDQKTLVGILTKGDVIEGLLKKLEIDYQEQEARHFPARYLFDNIEADDTSLQLRYNVKGQDFTQAGDSSTRLKRTLRRLGLRSDLVRRIAIASYEAEMNLVIYTEGGRIRAEVEPARVFVEIEDSGPGIADLEKALEPGYSTAPEWVREMGFGAGMGLVNMKKSADEFIIESEPGRGTTLNVSFRINEEPHEVN